MTKKFTTLAAWTIIALGSHPTHAQEATYTARYLEEFKGALAYKDSTTGILFYVESDGQHISAINHDGKILWVREPFKDAKLKSYRTSDPRIVSIGKPSKARESNGKTRFVHICFNSSQFGLIDIKTGDFTFLGQD